MSGLFGCVGLSIEPQLNLYCNIRCVRIQVEGTALTGSFSLPYFRPFFLTPSSVEASCARDRPSKMLKNAKTE